MKPCAMQNLGVQLNQARPQVRLLCGAWFCGLCCEAGA